ncbi:MAG: hypothetical protein DMG01_26160 [Acidobacteria bacterium]|nr:MAG: hypothetical protein DMG01_26160 [Acidobacteriota bacterium]
MKKWLLVLPLMALVPLRATADDSLVRFDGGIGVDPISGIVSNAPALNVVRGVPPGGFPWVIKRLRADVQSDGRIHVDGRGLLFAGGNAIGTNGGQRVLALLFCGAPGAGGSLGNATAHSSDPAGVPLEANGDFRIDDVLTPAPPAPCDNAALLIATPGTHRWFTAGIPKADDHDHDPKH